MQKMYPIYADIYDDFRHITCVAITYSFMTDVSKIWPVSLLWRYTYQIIILIHINILLHIINNQSMRHLHMLMTLIYSPLSHNTVECKWWKIFTSHLHNICEQLIYCTFYTQKMWNDIHHLHAVFFCVLISLSCSCICFHIVYMYNYLYHYKSACGNCNCPPNEM